MPAGKFFTGLDFGTKIFILQKAQIERKMRVWTKSKQKKGVSKLLLVYVGFGGKTNIKMGGQLSDISFYSIILYCDLSELKIARGALA
ncbi:MAG: hypothetical protein Q8R42_07430 [Desulfocapsaceae bacterium]|nr:hypothetical protein [Desulfocapsaceae bacterium]